MKFLLPLIILFASTFALAQDASVISRTANLRGTPTLKGVKLTSLPNATSMKIFGSDGTWYLVQTPKYVGWMYYKLIKAEGTKTPRKITFFERAKVVGNNVVLRGTSSDHGMKTATLRANTNLEVLGTFDGWYLVQTRSFAGWLPERSMRVVRPRRTSLSTTKTGNTIFQVEAADGRKNPKIRIRNDANRTLQLTFGGIRYVIKPKRGRILEFAPGKYKYTAAGGGATPFTRIENFKKGKVYQVSFKITTSTPRRRR